MIFVDVLYNKIMKYFSPSKSSGKTTVKSPKVSTRGMKQVKTKISPLKFKVPKIKNVKIKVRSK